MSAQVRGGSDIINYNFDWPNGVGNAPCLRDAYGFIKSLDKNPTMVQSVLQTMYNNGQRRLGIELLWSRDPANAQSGLVMSPTADGKMTDHDRQNFATLLGKIKGIGFREILLQNQYAAPNNPKSWGGTWNQDLYNEDFSYLADARSIILANWADETHTYKIDLGNEQYPNHAVGVTRI